MEAKYLVCVTSANNNKFYEIQPDTDGNGFMVKYGRIGGQNPSTQHYDAKEYDRILKNKLKKGYVDQTELVKKDDGSVSTGADGFADIQDVDVRKFVKQLRVYANEVIKKNYTIDEGHITQTMIDKAQELIDKLYTQDGDYKSFNDTLMTLFRTLPRKMTDVSKFFAKSNSDIPSILTREQNLFNIVKTQFETNAAKAKTNGDGASSKTETILEKFGLDFRKVTDQEKDQIVKHLGMVGSRYKQAWRIINKTTQDKFDAFCRSNGVKEPKMFFHGSRNENWWNIIKNGLLLKNNAHVTGKMLGAGLYFAPKAAKSINYTSLRGSYWSGGTSDVGLMAVFDVAVDEDKGALNVSTGSEISSCSGMTWDKLQKRKPGTTHVHAHKGPYLREDEVVVYREDQTTIHFLVELKV